MIIYRLCFISFYLALSVPYLNYQGDEYNVKNRLSLESRNLQQDFQCLWNVQIAKCIATYNKGNVYKYN